MLFRSTTKIIQMRNAEGKRAGTAASCAVMPLLREEEDRLYVLSGDKRGYISREDAEVVEALEGEIIRGAISVNGNTSGRAKVKTRFGPSEKHRVVDQWKTGTAVTVLAKEGEFYQVTARGVRLWVHQEFLTGEGLEKLEPKTEETAGETEETAGET